MVKFEIKKVFSRVGGRIAAFLLLILVTAVSASAVRSVGFVDENGKITYGFHAARKLRTAKAEWTGLLTEEVLAEVIRQNAMVEATPEAQSHSVQDNNKAYAMKQGYSDIRDFINCSLSPFREYSYYRIDEVSPEAAKEIYDRRIRNLEDWLASDEAKDRYTEPQKAYFIRQYRKLETPMYYEDADGWYALLDHSQTIIMIMMLILSFLVCGIFSGEYQLKTDAVFFSSAEGRRRGVKAKIAAAVVIITVIYWVSIILYTAVVLSALGAGGSGSPIQVDFYGWKSFYNITFLEDYLLSVCGGYIGTMFILTAEMLVSVVTKSAVVSIAVPFIMLFIPSFIGSLRSVSGVLGLLPDQLLQVENAVRFFNAYEIGGTVAGALPILFILYSILFLLMVPVIYALYRKAEVT